MNKIGLLIVTVLLFFGCVEKPLKDNTEEKIRVIVWDSPDSPHSNAVMKAVVHGYGLEKDITANVITENKWDVIEEMITSSGSSVECLIRPVEGFGLKDILRAQKYYPEVQFFHALHNNVFARVYKFEETEPPVVCVVGAGDAEYRNNTSWGNGLEVWDADWDWNMGNDQASFSLGFITGRMLRLKDELNLKYVDSIGWWTTRFIMRQGCLREEPNRLTCPWDERNGYGRISWETSLNISDEFIYDIPSDPYERELGEVGGMTCTLFGNVQIVADEIDMAHLYVFYKNGVEIITTKKRIIEDFLKKEGIYIYTYRGLDKYGNQTKLSKAKVIKFKLQKLPILVKRPKNF